MTQWFLALAICFLGYLFGSLPFGYFAGRIAGTDIRRHGSGNIGATNVLRVLGKKWGYLVFAGDAFKGFLAVKLAAYLAGLAHVNVALAAVLGAVTCILGHNYTVWLKFKGGKGVA